MNLPFKDGYRITQKFGVNAAYYKQFGLIGHEGIDLVSKTSDWSVLCLADGVVVKDEDNAKSGAYGIYVTVWHPSLNKATQYCHLSRNFVNLNQEVKQGQPLGDMGSTGNSTGAHLHLNLFETDSNGIRLNKNNGYLGGIDPLPFLEEIMATPAVGNVSVDAKTFEELVRKSSLYDGFKADGYTEIEDVRKKIGSLENNVKGLEETNRNLNNLLSEKSNQLSTAQSRISTLESKVLDMEQRVNSLTDQAKKVPVLESENEHLLNQRDIWIESEKTFNRTIAQLKAENEALRSNSIKAVIIHILTTFKNWWKK